MYCDPEGRILIAMRQCPRFYDPARGRILKAIAFGYFPCYLLWMYFFFGNQFEIKIEIKIEVKIEIKIKVKIKIKIKDKRKRRFYWKVNRSLSALRFR